MLKRLLIFSAILFSASPSFAYREVYNAHSGRLDKVGIQESADVAVVCDSGAGLKTTGGGSWACGTFGGSTPTGTGFYHVNAGSMDAAARAVNINSADVTGVLPVANGGTAKSSASNDSVLVGNNAGTGYDQPALSDCTGAGKAVTYTASTNTFGCNTISGGSTPTGTGFVHINAGSQDAAARAVNLASDDVTGVLPVGNLSQNTSAKAINFIIDGGGSAITTGQKGYIEVPFAMDLVAWSVFADQSGSIQLDLWKDTFANFPPTVADTITGSEKPKLTSQVAIQDLALSSWTKSIASGDVIAVSVDTVSTVQRVTLSLWGRKTS